MSDTKHPFLDPDIHVRWSDLTPGRVEPDIAAGIRVATESIDAIADQDHEELTFANTFLALESATENLSAAWGRVSHLDAVCNSPELRKSYNAMLPKVSEFFSSIPLQDRLWTVLKKFAQSAESERLDAVQTRFINETLADFRESGAELLPSKKQRFQAIQKELDRVTQKYSENVLDATNAFELIIEDRTKLAGLPESALKAARMSAQEKGYGSENQPAWRFTLQMTLVSAGNEIPRGRIHTETALGRLHGDWEKTAQRQYGVRMEDPGAARREGETPGQSSLCRSCAGAAHGQVRNKCAAIRRRFARSH